jgi:putative membrane protein insertion efficiency factor
MSGGFDIILIFKATIRWIVKTPIWAYRFTLSSFLGNACRYHPSCSAYALEAVDTHGALRGSVLAVKRIGRCHPWGGSGLDLVPPATDTKSMSTGTKRAI